MQTSDQVAGEAREKLAQFISDMRRYAVGTGRPYVAVSLSTEQADLIVAALRAQPERGADKTGTEQIARAMCRHQIEINQTTWAERIRMSDESRQRAEDAGWQQWIGFAEAVTAAIRALPLHPAKDSEDRHE